MANYKTFVSVTALLLLTQAMHCEVGKWGAEEENDVVVLGDNNFDDFLSRHEWVFVKYYAPWCGHCKNMAPAYAELALDNKYKADGIPIVKVDATVAKGVAEKMKPQGFPTLRLYNRGFEIEYKGGRDKKDIQAFIDQKLAVKPQLIDSVDEFDELTGARLAAIYYLESTESVDVKAFNRFILQFDNNIPFAYTHNIQIKERMGAKSPAALYVVRNFDDGSKLVEKERPFTDKELASEFKKVRFGYVMEYNDDVADRLAEEKKHTVYLFTEDKYGAGAQAFASLAPKYTKDFFFVTGNANDEKLKRTAEYFGINKNEQVRLMAYKGGKNQKFKVNEVSESAIKQLLDDYLAGKARQYLKTDSIPLTNDQPVKVVVGANFNELVLKSNKHVLLEIYAPWCGHCKHMEPVYNQLAAELAAYDDLTIAKMDGTTNEYPKVEANGYPTILFFEKGKKDKPIKYEGEKTLQKFLVFLNRHIGRVHKLATASEL